MLGLLERKKQNKNRQREKKNLDLLLSLSITPAHTHTPYRPSRGVRITPETRLKGKKQTCHCVSPPRFQSLPGPSLNLCFVFRSLINLSAFLMFLFPLLLMIGERALFLRVRGVLQNERDNLVLKTTSVCLIYSIKSLRNSVYIKRATSKLLSPLEDKERLFFYIVNLHVQYVWTQYIHCC